MENDITNELLKGQPNELARTDSQADVMGQGQSADSGNVGQILDSVFGKVGVDVNDLRAYDDLNWDAVNGIDDIARGIAKSQSLVLNSLQSQINKAYNNTDETDKRIQSSLIGRILTPQQSIEESHAAIANSLSNRVDAITTPYLGSDGAAGSYIVYRPKADVGFVPSVEELKGPPLGLEYYGPFAPLTKEQEAIITTLPTRPLSAVISSPQPQVVEVLSNALDPVGTIREAETTINPVDPTFDLGPVPINTIQPGRMGTPETISAPVLDSPISVSPPAGTTPTPTPTPEPTPTPTPTPEPIVINDPKTGCTIQLLLPEIKVAPCQSIAPDVDYNLISTIVTNVVNTVLNNITNNNQQFQTNNVLNQQTTINQTTNNNQVDNSQTDNRQTTTNINNEGSGPVQILNDLSTHIANSQTTNNYTDGSAADPSSTIIPSNRNCLTNKGDLFFGTTACGEASWDEFLLRHNIPLVELPTGQKLGDVIKTVNDFFLTP